MFKRKNTRIICHISYTSTHSLPMSFYILLHWKNTRNFNEEIHIQCTIWVVSGARMNVFPNF